MLEKITSLEEVLDLDLEYIFTLQESLNRQAELQIAISWFQNIEQEIETEVNKDKIIKDSATGKTHTLKSINKDYQRKRLQNQYYGESFK